MNFAEQLKSQIDIVRTIGEYVPLKKVGSRYSGLCPFHTEKTPSFSVNPVLGIFICFGCGKKGDVLAFVQELEQLTFPETLSLLAERNGIAMPARNERRDPASDLREVALEMHEAAAAAFAENLLASANGEVRQYLASRGLTQRIVEQFRLGYSERAGQDLIKRFRGRFSTAQMEASGLFGKREDGTFFDRFRGRLMFPIHNESGKVIAFGGRALGPEDEPKYLNSPKTVLYEKKHVLYNLHRAKETIRKNERTVLVEGYMDVIGVFASGVKNVVASCGTSLTTEQVKAMKRHSSNVTVNFDPDNAGANATERSIELLLEEAMHVRVLELEGGLDPDEYIKNCGADVYSQRLDRAAGYFVWLADRARKTHDMATSEGRMAGFEALLLPAIRRISGHLEQAVVATEVADYLGIERSLVLQQFRRSPAPRPQTRPVKARELAAPMTERIVLRTLITEPESRELILPVISESQAARRYIIWPILEVLIELWGRGADLSFTTIDSKLAESEKTLLSGAFFADKNDEVFSLEQSEGYLENLRGEDRKLEMERLKADLRDAERGGRAAEAFSIMENLNQLARATKK